MTPAETLKREMARAKREALELALLRELRAHKVPEPYRQHRFHPSRRWLFDFAWPVLEVSARGEMPMRMGGLAVEVDGGTFSGGRHVRGKGYAADCEKLNEAALLGWCVIRVTGATIKNGQALGWILRGLDAIGIDR